jgi:hypothetical protein
MSEKKEKLMFGKNTKKQFKCDRGALKGREKTAVQWNLKSRGSNKRKGFC